jgi:hypothetical protein
VLRRRQQRAFRRAVLDTLTPRQLENVVRFSNKATGWFMVGSGAFFIAVKETWELDDAYEWPVWAFWLLVVAMPALCASNTALRMKRGHDMIAGTGGSATS